MKFPSNLIIITFALLFSGCMEKTHSPITYRGLEPELHSQIFITAQSLGHWYYKDRDVHFEDFQIELTNLTANSIWVSSVSDEYLSEYILERNPLGYSYQTWGEPSYSHLSMGGLGGPGPQREVTEGESITFIAPIPLHRSPKTEGLFRIEMRIYQSSDQIRPIRSAILVQSPIANKTVQETGTVP